MREVRIRFARSSRWARISGNRPQNICKLVPMSRDTHVPRYRTWNFSHSTAIPCIHPYFRKQRAGCTQQAQLIQLSSSRVCSTNFSRAALQWACTRRLHPFASLPRGVRSLCIMPKNWCRFARSSICGLHSGPISRWPIKSAIMVGRKVDSRRV